MSNKYFYTFKGLDARGEEYILSFTSPVEIEWSEQPTWEEFE